MIIIINNFGFKLRKTFVMPRRGIGKGGKSIESI